jgi:hypothetical protein
MVKFKVFQAERIKEEGLCSLVSLLLLQFNFPATAKALYNILRERERDRHHHHGWGTAQHTHKWLFSQRQTFLKWKEMRRDARMQATALHV